VYNKIKDTK